MSKYGFDSHYTEYATPVLIPGEQVLWQSKPKKNAFIINKVVGLLPIAVIWLLFDSFFLVQMLSGPKEMLTILIPFMALHLMPVWLWLANALTANRRWKNTMYYVTDRRILIQSGLAGHELQTVYYKDIHHVNLRMGMIDRLLHVGDIYFDLGQYSVNRKTNTAYHAFLDLEDPQRIYTRIQKIILDMQTDIAFPNAYRPEENPGYSTRYKG